MIRKILIFRKVERKIWMLYKLKYLKNYKI
jgi:hypothetical protein